MSTLDFIAVWGKSRVLSGATGFVAESKDSGTGYGGRVYSAHADIFLTGATVPAILNAATSSFHPDRGAKAMLQRYSEFASIATTDKPSPYAKTVTPRATASAWGVFIF